MCMDADWLANVDHNALRLNNYKKKKCMFILFFIFINHPSYLCKILVFIRILLRQMCDIIFSILKKKVKNSGYVSELLKSRGVDSPALSSFTG